MLEAKFKTVFVDSVCGEVGVVSVVELCGEAGLGWSLCGEGRGGGVRGRGGRVEVELIFLLQHF